MGNVLSFSYLCCTDDKLEDKTLLLGLSPVTRVRSESEVQSMWLKYRTVDGLFVWLGLLGFFGGWVPKPY